MTLARWIIAGGSLLALVAGASVSLAQPSGVGGERRVRDAVTERMDDPAVLRARLERAIERGERMLERHRQAITRLDAGDSPAEVVRSLRWRGDEDKGEPMPPPPGPDAEGDNPDAPDTGGPMGRGPVRDRIKQAIEDGRVSPEMRERLRAFLRERLPSVDAQLAQVEQADAEMGARLFDRLVPQLRDIANEMDRDPAFGQLRLDEMKSGLAVVDATQRLRGLNAQSPPGDRANAEAALRQAIADRFDARIKIRQHELERLAARIGELHQQIQDEQGGRDAEIERVYQAVLSQKWGAPAEPRHAGRPEGDKRQP